MNIPKIDVSDSELAETMGALGTAAAKAARILAQSSTETKNKALNAMADAVDGSVGTILTENAKDLDAAQSGGMTKAFVDRLTLTPDRIKSISDGLRAVAALPDPVGTEIAKWQQPNGLEISRIRTPLGVVGVIYESRPNVTADAGALCLKSGNAVILRGGSDSWHSSRAIHACLVDGLKSAGLPADAIQLVPTRDRAAVGEMLKGLGGTIDVIIPRGGKSLVERVQNEARVPVFAHLEGICHLYVHPSADVAMAVELALNSKMRRTGICGALECLLIDRAALESHGHALVKALLEAGCAIRGDAEIQALDARVEPATDVDWGKEFLDTILAAKVVDGLNDACAHIETYGSAHTDAIASEDMEAVDAFFHKLDSAILLHNASTQFADGGEFGMGAEIGIATGKFHARGPVGLEQLTSFHYQVRGNGQVRP